MNLEPEKVEEERDSNETKGSRGEVLGEFLDRQATFDIKKVPEINSDSGTNCNKGENTNIFGGNDTR